MSFALVLSLLVPYASATTNTTANPFKSDRQNESIIQQKMAITEQLQLLKQAPRLHKDLENLKGEENVDVIIMLSEKPVALEQGIKELAGKKFTSSNAKAAKSKVQAQHKLLKKEMSAKKITFKEGFSYSTVLNGFSASVKANDLNKLLEIEGVTLVEPDSEVHAYEDTSATSTSENGLAMDTSISFLGVEDIWNEGFEGEGIKVAVLDTGIDYEHPEFDGIYKGGFNFVPHTGSDYAAPRADDDPYETTPSERPASKPEFNANGSSFYTSHGTHVAGTIAAIGANGYGIKGIAPKVDLYAYRVLGAYGSGSNAGVIAGINKAVEEGMDVINLSLGGGSNDSTTADTIAINNAMLAGTVSVLATGNSGPNRGTIGTPAAAALGIAVGNTTNPETTHNGTVSVEAGSFELSKDLKFMGTTYGTDLAEQLAGEFDLVSVPGVGAVKDFDGIDVNGKVALISRGEIAFVDKIANAKKEGAVATIIHNSSNGSNAPGISDVFLGDDFEFLPTIDMSYTDGAAIRAALADADGTVTFGEFGSESSSGDAVNSSSSRGPTKPHFDIKPDVSAPGTNIMSSVPRYGKEIPDADYSTAFERFTGTSMATPHIAGVAALIMNANPEWDAFDVKVALSNTAKVLDTEKFDVFAQGPGRVQPYKAAFPAALAYAEDTVVTDGNEVANVKGTVTFGHHPEVVDGDVSSTKQIRVENLSGNSSDYDVTVEVTKAFGDAKVTVDTTSFTLEDEKLLNVTLEAPQAVAPTGSELLGYIHITDGVTDLSLPFAVDFSPAVPEAVTDYHLTETDLSFNGDGVKDEGELKFTLRNIVLTNYIELFDIQNQDAGEYGDGYIGYLHASDYLFPDSYTLPIDGQYVPWGGNQLEQIPDGIYTVDFTAQNAGAGPSVLQYWDGPLFVKSTSAEIVSAEEHVADDSTYEFTGNLVDKYIEYQTVLEQFGLGYNLNTKLQTTFEAKDEAGNVVSNGPVNLAQNGTFGFDVTGLQDGNNNVTISVIDAAGNSAEATFVVSYEAPEEPGEPEDPEKMSRISGIDRYQTALEISSEGWESAETVIIARGNDFADALAGVPLAHAFEAPILLTLTDELSDNVLAEIERLGATQAIVLGGNAAVSENVSKELVNANIHVTRAGGDDRFATAAAIAELIAPDGADEVVIANGMDFPDALSVASHAAQAGTPILLTLKGSVPAETQEALESLGTTKTVVVGGTSVVSDAVASELPSANRLGGIDRYETNTLIAEYYNVDNDHLYVATGKDYADALTGAVLAANTNSGVLLVHAIVPEFTSSYITKNEVQRLTIFGGENAVSEKVYSELERLID